MKDLESNLCSGFCATEFVNCVTYGPGYQVPRLLERRSRRRFLLMYLLVGIPPPACWFSIFTHMGDGASKSTSDIDDSAAASALPPDDLLLPPANFDVPVSRDGPRTTIRFTGVRVPSVVLYGGDQILRVQSNLGFRFDPPGGMREIAFQPKDHEQLFFVAGVRNGWRMTRLNGTALEVTFKQQAREQIKEALEAANESGTLEVEFEVSREEEDREQQEKARKPMTEEEQARHDAFKATVAKAVVCPVCNGSGRDGGKCGRCDGAGFIS